MDCHEGDMLILRHEDEAHAKPMWMARALSQPKCATSSPRNLTDAGGVPLTDDTQ